MLAHLGPKFLETIAGDAQLRADLRQLVTEADQVLQHQEEFLKVWDSDTTIYQVIKQLETEGLIAVTRSEIHRGRGRRVYALTDTWRMTAFGTIMLFGDLFQSILPYLTLFPKEWGLINSKHQYDVLHLFERVLPGEYFSQLLSSINLDSPLTHFLGSLFPFLLNAALFFSILFGNFLPLAQFDETLPQDYDRAAYRQLLLDRLKDSQQRIGEVIQQLEHGQGVY